MANEQGGGSARWGAIKSVLDVGSTIAMLVAAGAIVWAVTRGPSGAAGPPPSPPVPTEPVSLEGAPRMGDPAAKIVLIEFSDFECPFCGRFTKEVLPAIKAKYVDTGLVQLAFRHFPLDTIHQRAIPAATAAVCAQEQEKFWEFHDLLFEDVKKLSDDDIKAYAGAASLDVEAFTACQSNDGEASKRVSSDRAQANALSLRGTPAFLVGTQAEDGRVRVVEVIPGMPSVEGLSAVLDAIGK